MGKFRGNQLVRMIGGNVSRRPRQANRQHKGTDASPTKLDRHLGRLVAILAIAGGIH